MPEALCSQELAACAMREGDLDTAIEHQRHAIGLLRRAGSRTDGVIAELNYCLLLLEDDRLDEARVQVGELLSDPRIRAGDHAHQAAHQIRCVVAVRLRDRTELERALEALIEAVGDTDIVGAGFASIQGELVRDLRSLGWDDAADRAATLAPAT